MPSQIAVSDPRTRYTSPWDQSVCTARREASTEKRRRFTTGDRAGDEEFKIIPILKYTRGIVQMPGWTFSADTFPVRSPWLFH
jgi:hypothetical protein